MAPRPNDSSTPATAGVSDKSVNPDIAILSCQKATMTRALKVTGGRINDQLTGPLPRGIFPLAAPHSMVSLHPPAPIHPEQDLGMSESLSPNLAYLKPSETVAISNETRRRRAAGEDIVDLSLGEPDFDTPRLVCEAGIQAIQKGYTRYPPNAGIAELRTAVARNLSLDTAIAGSPVDFHPGAERYYRERGKMPPR